MVKSEILVMYRRDQSLAAYAPGKRGAGTYVCGMMQLLAAR